MTNRNKFGRNDAIVTGSALLGIIGMVVRGAADSPSDASLVPGWFMWVHVLAIILTLPVIFSGWRRSGPHPLLLSVAKAASLVSAITSLVMLVAHVHHGSYEAILDRAAFAVFFPAACWLPNAITNPTNTKENRA